MYHIDNLKKILLIDDDKTIRETLSLALEEEGFIVDTAEDGKEAISKSFENYCNIAIVDARAATQQLRFLKTFPARNRIKRFIKRCLHKSGKVVVLETRSISIFDPKGNLVGVRGVDRDITEKKEMEKKLLKSERLAAVGEVATMVAHDLRNPLQSIATAIYYLEKTISMRARGSIH